VDRLSRELVHLLILKPEIEKKARLEFVASKFEDSPSGRLFFGIRGVISQYEREQIRERTMRGKRERAQAGLVVGGRVAYGYRYEQGKLIPDEPQKAQTVREIFSWYEAGLSIRAIGRRLRENGKPSWLGKASWGHSSVRRILVNETYAGVAYYGTHQRAGVLLRRREPVDRIGFSVPALVSREQWQRVQAKLAVNPNCGKPSIRYLLRGLLHCECGRRMSGNNTRGHISYRCNGRDRGAGEPQPKCRKCVSASGVDAAIWRAISEAFCDERILRAMIAKRQAELQAPEPGSSGDIKALRNSLVKMKRREKTVLEALLDPELAAGRTAIKAEYRKAQQECSHLEWEIATLERQARVSLDAHQWLDSTVAAVREYIPSLTTTGQRQEFLRGFVTRAEWDGVRQVKINCLFGSELSTTSARSAQFDALQITLIARVA